MPEVSSITGLDNYNLTGQDKFTKSTGDLLNAFLSRLPVPVCLVAHNGNAYDFPLLRAELVKAGAEFGPNIFCVDSYVGIKEIFKMDMGYSLAKRVKPKDTENIEEKEIVKNEMEAGEFDMEMGSSLAECMKPTENIEEKEIVKNEMEAVKSLLEAGGFDMEMDIDRSKSIKFRKLLEKKQSRNIDSLVMLIEKTKSKQTPPRYSSIPSRTIKIVKKKQLQNRGVLTKSFLHHNPFH